MCLDIVGLVPPKKVDADTADSMSKCIEFEQRDCQVLTDSCDTLDAEPKGLRTSDELGESASFTWVLQCRLLEW